MSPPANCTVKTFYISSKLRDTSKYPSGSDFTYSLPVTLTNVVGIAIRDYKFSPETLINNNNRQLRVYIDDGSTDVTVQLATGNYNNTVSDVLTALNTLLLPYQVAFTLNVVTNRVEFAFTNTFVTDYIYLAPCGLLKILGFPSGILLYRTTIPVNYPSGVSLFLTTAVAPNVYDVHMLSDMVVRIADLETISSPDAVTNRATAVLFNSQPNYVTKQCLDHYIPLMQTQSRVQSLRIKLMNVEGDPYDTVYNDAAFLLEVFCCNELC
jgi:hypothetical protein